MRTLKSILLFSNEVETLFSVEESHFIFLYIVIYLYLLIKIIKKRHQDKTLYIVFAIPYTTKNSQNLVFYFKKTRVE